MRLEDGAILHPVLTLDQLGTIHLRKYFLEFPLVLIMLVVK